MADFQTQEFLVHQILETRDLGKRYGAVHALDQINLTLDQEGVIGLVGKNGAGKTTFLSVISGALEPSTGSVNVLGHCPGSPQLLGKTSILPQDANFKKGIPVVSQLIHFSRLQGLGKEAATKEVFELLELLNNAAYAHKNPEVLSYGQRKRLGLVQTFIGDPELILLDEPTAGLDPTAASDVRQLIRSYQGKTTFIISSHNLYEIQDICSRVIILDNGRLITNATVAELTNQKNLLKITLNREPEPELISELLQLDDVIDIYSDKGNGEILQLQYKEGNTDKLQLRIQSIIIEKGYSILHFTRGKSLVDGVLDLVSGK